MRVLVTGRCGYTGSVVSAELVASSERIIEELGWQPEHPGLEDIVRSVWDWHRTYLNGYEDRKLTANG